MFLEAAKEHLNDEKKSQEPISSTEFVSDSYDQNGINEDEIKNDLKQLKLDNKKLEGKNCLILCFYLFYFL